MNARRLALALLVVLVGLAAVPPVPACAAVPAGFADDPVTSVAGLPTALAFTPDGRLLVTTQGGTLQVYASGMLSTALTFDAANLCANSERGLLGVAVHPQFASNTFIYLFYTAELSGGACVNRVSRFTLPATNVVDPLSELVLVDNMPSPAGNHNAGDVEFGRDGYLYITIGDGGCDYAGNSGCGGGNDAARDEHTLTGKVLRITDVGGIPPSNPFQGAGTASCRVTGTTTPGNRCQETFAWGFRNPFRFAFDPNDAGTRFFVNDVGQNAWEEIDGAQAGADYGWNCREGAHTNSASGPCNPTPAGMLDPFFEYQHGQQIPGTSSPTNCNAITGGAFVPNGMWPPAYDGSYLFADLCGFIGRIDAAGSPPPIAANFGSSLGGIVHLRFGPFGGTQALYYTNTAGQVRRISYPIPRRIGPLDYFTVAPCRAVDTRGADGPALQPGTPRSFTIAGDCGVPSAAAAVALNVTVVAPSATGFVQLRRSDEAPLDTSVINFVAGSTRANNAMVTLGTDGALVATATGAIVHLVIDVVGYYEGD